MSFFPNCQRSHSGIRVRELLLKQQLVRRLKCAPSLPQLLDTLPPEPLPFVLQRLELAEACRL